MLEDLFAVCIIIDFQLFFSALRFYYIFQFPLCSLKLPLAPTLGPASLEAVVAYCSFSPAACGMASFSSVSSVSLCCDPVHSIVCI